MTDEELISRLKNLYPKQDSTNFTVYDLIHAQGSAIQALLYLRLYWPDFILIEGMVFSAITVQDDEDRAAIIDYYIMHGRDLQNTEKTFNYIEVEYLFAHHRDLMDDEDMLDFANKLCAMWSAKLSKEFPARRFRVEVVDPEGTGGECAVWFYQTG